jgi:hypothetical protein
VPGTDAREVRREPHPGHLKTLSPAIMRGAERGISPHGREGVKVVIRVAARSPDIYRGRSKHSHMAEQLTVKAAFDGIREEIGHGVC